MKCYLCKLSGTKKQPLQGVGKKMVPVHKRCITKALLVAKACSPSVIGPKEAAHMLNIHVNTLRRWSSNGIIKATRVGPNRDRRFERSDVEALLKANMEESKDLAKE